MNSQKGGQAMTEPGAMELWLDEQPFGDAVAMDPLRAFAVAHDAADAEREALIARLVEALDLMVRAAQHHPSAAQARVVLTAAREAK